MTTYVRKPLPIDREKTNLWAIASLVRPISRFMRSVHERSA
jgi:hypothetical protein